MVVEEVEGVEEPWTASSLAGALAEALRNRGMSGLLVNGRALARLRAELLLRRMGTRENVLWGQR